MEPEGSLPHSQTSATCPYPGPAQSSPYTHIPPPGDPSYIYIYIYTHTHTHTQGVSRLVDNTAGGDFLGHCDQNSSYKHVSDFGRLRSYDRLKLRIEGNDY